MAEALSFSDMVLQLHKYPNYLLGLGFSFKFEDKNNVYDDNIVLSKVVGNKTYQCMIQMFSWNMVKKMVVSGSHNADRAVVYRYNAVAGEFVKMEVQGATGGTFFVAAQPNISGEHRQFVHDVYELVNSIAVRYKQDFVAYTANFNI